MLLVGVFGSCAVSFFVNFCMSSQSSLIVILKPALLFCYSTATFPWFSCQRESVLCVYKCIFGNFLLSTYAAKFWAHLMFWQSGPRVFLILFSPWTRSCASKSTQTITNFIWEQVSQNASLELTFLDSLFWRSSDFAISRQAQTRPESLFTLTD